MTSQEIISISPSRGLLKPQPKTVTIVTQRDLSTAATSNYVTHVESSIDSASLVVSPRRFQDLTVYSRPLKYGVPSSTAVNIQRNSVGSNEASAKLHQPSSSGTARNITVALETKKRHESAIIRQKLAKFRSQLPHHYGMAAYSALAAQDASQPKVIHGSDLFTVPIRRPRTSSNASGATSSIQISITAIKSLTARNHDHHTLKVKSRVIKCLVKPVPTYRGHLVETQTNIFAPLVPLVCTPHITETLTEEDEMRRQEFVTNLRYGVESNNFQMYIGEERIARILCQETAVAVRAEMNIWLQELNIPHVTYRQLLLNLLKTQNSSLYTDWDVLLGGVTGCQNLNEFEHAFEEVFNVDSVDSKHDVPIKLKDVLELDIDDVSLFPSKDEDRLDKTLETHMALQCLQCFSYSCDHGHYDKDYKPLQDSLARMNTRFSDLRDDAIAIRSQMGSRHPVFRMEKCSNNCFLESQVSTKPRRFMRRDKEYFTERDEKVMVVAGGAISRNVLRAPPSCIAAVYLERSCDELHMFAKSRCLYPPKLQACLSRPKDTFPPPPAPPLSWYDRFTKTLKGNWASETARATADFIILHHGCSHEGPCTKNNCTCVQLHVFCRAECRCTVNSCSYQFTGCSCHAEGMTCVENSRSCVCRMLNSECDPALCNYCGVVELIDPHNRQQVLSLPSIKNGCQNCDIQLRRTKKVMVGRSKIPGINGYGLFALENIPANSFVIEYTGEKVSQDEGIRRSIRRGEGYSETEEFVCSYLFTLLENEGTWLDAAKYGNKSRFVNHGNGPYANLQPLISYVINGFRIKFVAKRNIKLGEELLFNYGSHFPNLINLMDTSAKRTSSQEEATQMAATHALTKKRKTESRQTMVKAKFASKEVVQCRRRSRMIVDSNDGSEGSLYSDFE